MTWRDRLRCILGDHAWRCPPHPDDCLTCRLGYNCGPIGNWKCDRCGQRR